MPVASMSEGVYVCVSPVVMSSTLVNHGHVMPTW